MSVTNNTNFVVDGTFSTSDRQGYRFTVNNTTKVTQINVSASVAPTKGYILLQSDKSQLGTANFSGTTCTFSGSGVSVTAGTTYIVIVDGNGGSWNSAYKNSQTFPVNNTDLNFTGNEFYNGSWNFNTGGSPVGGVVSVITDAGASGPTNLKSLSGNLKANIKSISGNLIANVKSFSGNS